jgi:hypothetical protein
MATSGPKSSLIGDRRRLSVRLGFEFFLGAMLVFGGKCHQTGALAFSPLLKQAGAFCWWFMSLFFYFYTLCRTQETK